MSLRLDGRIERRRLVVELFVRAPDGADIDGPYRGMTDTGASVTVLANEVARNLALPDVGKGTVRGITGDEHARFVRLSIGVPGSTGAPYFLEDDVVAAVRRRVSDPNAVAPWDVLIGMDVIERGVLTVDGPAATFAFEIA